MLKYVTILVVFLAVSSLAEKARFDNYRVYRLTPRTEQQLVSLKYLELERRGYDFWTSARKVGIPVDIMVAPHQFAQFHEYIEEHDFEYSIQIPNVQGLMDTEQESIRTRPKAFGWTSYYSLNEIYNWLATLEEQNPGVVTQVVGGSTYEGRQIRGIEINFSPNNPGVYIESGIHAREWIAPAASSWIVNEVLNSPADSIYRRFNYLYFPSVNPDGYEFTHTTDRLWRKTRTPYRTSFGTCHGADPNRNWNNHWLGTDMEINMFIQCVTMSVWILDPPTDIIKTNKRVFIKIDCAGN